VCAVSATNRKLLHTSVRSRVETGTAVKLFSANSSVFEKRYDVPIERAVQEQKSQRQGLYTVGGATGLVQVR
jgi:hypothetical protein